MLKVKSITKILKNEGHPIDLCYDQSDYWYFIYDDGKIFETESVYVYRLNQLGLEDWLEIGRKFINKVTEENK